MIDPESLDWAKMDGLLPAIVQDTTSGTVRMLGYVDRAALEATIADRLVTFHSRARGRRWRKGETSGNLLDLVDIRTDCDRDALLILAAPRGPTCHIGSDSCFGDDAAQGTGFLAALAATLEQRALGDPETSYTARLAQAGVKRIAQKVGEEGVEVVLAAVSGDAAEVTAEAADLLYHLTLLLPATGSSWRDVIAELKRRQANPSSATASS